MAAVSSRRGGLIEGINVTPLVDITLVLLIIFMVTAKIVVQPSINVDLPTASQGDSIQMVFVVTIRQDGSLLVDGQEQDAVQLAKKAVASLANDPDLRAIIQADRQVPHGRVIEVLDVLKSAGIVRVAFGTQAPIRADSISSGSGNQDELDRG